MSEKAPTFPVAARISDASGRPRTAEDDLFGFWRDNYQSALAHRLSPATSSKSSREAAIDRTHADIVGNLADCGFEIGTAAQKPRSKQDPDVGWKYDSAFAVGHYKVERHGAVVAFFGIEEVDVGAETAAAAARPRKKSTPAGRSARKKAIGSKRAPRAGKPRRAKKKGRKKAAK